MPIDCDAPPGPAGTFSSADLQRGGRHAARLGVSAFLRWPPPLPPSRWRCCATHLVSSRPFLIAQAGGAGLIGQPRHCNYEGKGQREREGGPPARRTRRARLCQCRRQSICPCPSPARDVRKPPSMLRISIAVFTNGVPSRRICKPPSRSECSIQSMPGGSRLNPRAPDLQCAPAICCAEQEGRWSIQQYLG